MSIEEVVETQLKISGLKKHTKIILGVSGGPDSICLLDILIKAEYQTIIAHFNHQIREEADAEFDFVKKLSQRYQCEIITRTENIPEIARHQKKGIEVTAREQRYQFLFSSAEKFHAEAVIVAHHADDQIETILMNMLRGTGLDGLAGMKVVSFGQFNNSIPLVRPMLYIWRGEIRAYCEEKGLDFIVDRSNEDILYLRNRIRHQLIPMLESYNPQVKDNLLRMQALVYEDQKALNDLADSAEKDIELDVTSRSIRFCLKDFACLSVSLQRILIKRILRTNLMHQDWININLIEKIRHFFLGDISANYLRIGKGLKLIREVGFGIIVEDLNSVWEGDWPVLDRDLYLSIQPGEFPISKKWLLVIEKINKSDINSTFKTNENPYNAYLDGDKMSDQLVIRKWMPGDRYQPLGMNGKTTKLSDFWINHKVPKRARSSWPLVFCADDLVWVPGYQPAHSISLNDTTKNVIILKLVRTD